MSFPSLDFVSFFRNGSLCFPMMQFSQQNFWSLKMMFLDDDVLDDLRIFFTWFTFWWAIRLCQKKGELHTAIFSWWSSVMTLNFITNNLPFLFSIATIFPFFTNVHFLSSEYCRILFKSCTRRKKIEIQFWYVKNITEILTFAPTLFHWKQEYQYLLIQLLEYIFFNGEHWNKICESSFVGLNWFSRTNKIFEWRT